MPDFKQILEAYRTLLETVFGRNLPEWIMPASGVVLLLGFIGTLLTAAIMGISYAADFVSHTWLEKIGPRFYKHEDRQRVTRRRRFADHIEAEIRRLNNLEDWQDYRFAELEAEIEATGAWRSKRWWPFGKKNKAGLHIEPSLSTALERSQERLILLEGDPGSGKSVALRHLAQIMAHRAMEANTVNSLIPVYVNLKGLTISNSAEVNMDLIESFVLKTLNRANDRDIQVFLEEEFANGLHAGTWLFLFDSFDEIPQVLSSIETDEAIRLYADAISDFLHGMNQCRGVVASRHFRGGRMSSVGSSAGQVLQS